MVYTHQCTCTGAAQQGQHEGSTTATCTRQHDVVDQQEHLNDLTCGDGSTRAGGGDITRTGGRQRSQQACCSCFGLHVGLPVPMPPATLCNPGTYGHTDAALATLLPRSSETPLQLVASRHTHNAARCQHTASLITRLVTLWVKCHSCPAAGGSTTPQPLGRIIRR